MSEIITVIAQLSAFAFIITSMLAMDLSLTVKQILDPLRNVRVVLLALLANCVLVPALAYLITVVIPLDDGLATGLIIVGAAAGAPFLPKLVQVAKGNAAFSVGLMTLLMVVTVIYLPVMLPILLPGASVSPWDIAQSLIFTMLLPLGIGLFIRARYEEAAASLQPHMSQISSLAIVLMPQRHQAQDVASCLAIANVLAGLSVTGVQDLNFGDCLQGVAKSVLNNDAANAGIFQVNGQPGAGISMYIALPPYLATATGDDRMNVLFGITDCSIDSTISSSTVWRILTRTGVCGGSGRGSRCKWKSRFSETGNPGAFPSILLPARSSR